jgi:A/G-specific adenine glycosylase
MSRHALQDRADELVPPGLGWLWNQTMLDLGATVCGRRAPRCAACPLVDVCAWHDGPGADPASAAAIRTRPQTRFEGSDRQGRALLLRALLRGPVAAAELTGACGWPGEEDRARRVAAGLVRDGLARGEADGIVLA